MLEEAAGGGGASSAMLKAAIGALMAVLARRRVLVRFETGPPALVNLLVTLLELSVGFTR